MYADRVLPFNLGKSIKWCLRHPRAFKNREQRILADTILSSPDFPVRQSNSHRITLCDQPALLSHRLVVRKLFAPQHSYFILYPIWIDASLPFFLPTVNKLSSKQIIRTRNLRILTRSVNKVSTNFPSLPSNSPKVSKSSSCFFEISSTSKS